MAIKELSAPEITDKVYLRTLKSLVFLSTDYHSLRATTGEGGGGEGGKKKQKKNIGGTNK